MTDYEKFAGCGMAFFRHRWDKRPRFKNSTRKQQLVSIHRESCQTARRYFAKARAAKQTGETI